MIEVQNVPYRIENKFLHFRGADFVPTKIGPDGLYFPYCPFGPSKAVQNVPYRIENNFLHFRGADFDLTKQAPEGLYLRYYPFGASKAR